ncbi:elongation factor 1-delta [Aplysia californica]|uniref:Elongation factor 1-delta n=1 Tax=Aplysia californica TaxID=6500 RepID=A0ABM1VT33_APLCA|nr:elongation factor 1-delta [Aplysia californica]
MANPLALENVWLQQQKFEDANSLYIRLQSGTLNSSQQASSSLAGEIAQVRQDIQKALNKQPGSAGGSGGDASVYSRLDALEKENRELRKITDELRALILNAQSSGSAPAPAQSKPAPPPAAAPADADDDDDDDVDLFGSDDEDTIALKDKRLKEYAEKKAKKPGVIAKSNVVLDVKPWDDETDMAEMEKRVRAIEQDGLLWGASKLTEVGYGIKKLTIMCVVEDDKVGIDDLSEKITDENEDLVQSVDVAAFNKI